MAYCDDLGPVVLPVNYALDQDTVVIQISPYSTLAGHLRSAHASFQIDDFDDFNQTGWSVLVRGDAVHVDSADLPADDEDRPHAWAEGLRTFHVRITPHDISGLVNPARLSPRLRPSDRRVRPRPWAGVPGLAPRVVVDSCGLHVTACRGSARAESYAGATACRPQR